MNINMGCIILLQIVNLNSKKYKTNKWRKRVFSMVYFIQKVIIGIQFFKK